MNIKQIYLYIEHKETKNVIRRKDVTTKSPKSTQYLKTKWKAEFKETFWEDYEIKIEATETSKPIVDDKIIELK